MLNPVVVSTFLVVAVVCVCAECDVPNEVVHQANREAVDVSTPEEAENPQRATALSPAPPNGDVGRKSNKAFEFRPGILVDPADGVVYVMSQDRGIDVVDLSSGKRVWRTTRADKPLLLSGTLLVAQRDVADRLRIVGLDTADSGALLFRADVELPEGVRASLDDGLGTSFSVSARRHQDDLIISWRFFKQYISGVAPLPGETASAEQFSGAARIEIGTGQVEVVGPSELPPSSEARLPENVALLVETGALLGPVYHAGDVVAVATRVSDEVGRRVVLHRWHSVNGQPLPDVTLFEGGLTLRYASADNRHLLASMAGESDGPAWAWVIYSLETAEVVAEIRNTMPGAWFFLWDSSLMHESRPSRRLVDGKWLDEPLKIRAVELTTSAERWSWPVRDTAYGGPYPPATPDAAPSPGDAWGKGH